MDNRPPRITAIINPGTGRRQATALMAAIEAAVDEQAELDMVQTGEPGEATSLAQRAAAVSDIVVAVGGDGTANEVASGILGTPAKLGIVPAGSTNVIARSLGIPLDVEKSAQLLVAPHSERVLDVAMLGERVVLHMAGVGFDALIFRDTPPSLKRIAAWLAYVPTGVRHLGDQPWLFHITIDGLEITTAARMVLIANGASLIDNHFVVGHDIQPDDGLLDVIVVAPPHIAGAAEVASRFAMGQFERSRYVRQFKGKSVHIAAEPSAPVECDGELAGETPALFTIRPRAISIITPPRTTESG